MQKKVFQNFQHAVIIQILRKIEIGEKFLNLIKIMYKDATTNIILYAIQANVQGKDVCFRHYYFTPC